jgi:Leucine-rich repeat (LRR) protein
LIPVEPLDMAHSVQKVVVRCEDAEENGGKLDLSNCKLIQVPDALYFMIEERNIEITACNLSSNVIKKIPPKFPTKFNMITDLNLSHNKLSALPEEVSKLLQLETVDISHNLFISLQNCLFNLPKIIQINAAKNSITDVDIEMISTCESLENLNLEDNPLTRDCQEKMSSISKKQIKTTPRELEEWEDLSI